jgi:hypothetical protein
VEVERFRTGRLGGENFGCHSRHVAAMPAAS